MGDALSSAFVSLKSVLKPPRLRATLVTPTPRARMLPLVCELRAPHPIRTVYSRAVMVKCNFRSARAENHRFGWLGALRAHTKAPIQNPFIARYGRFIALDVKVIKCHFSYKHPQRYNDTYDYPRVRPFFSRDTLRI